MRVAYGCLFTLLLLLSAAFPGRLFAANAISPQENPEERVVDPAPHVERWTYPDGKIRSEIPYENLKRNGVARWYYPDGKLEAEITYREGAADGDAKWFYPDGEPKLTRKFRDGKLDGSWSIGIVVLLFMVLPLIAVFALIRLQLRKERGLIDAQPLDMAFTRPELADLDPSIYEPWRVHPESTWLKLSYRYENTSEKPAATYRGWGKLRGAISSSTGEIELKVPLKVGWLPTIRFFKNGECLAQASVKLPWTGLAYEVSFKDAIYRLKRRGTLFGGGIGFDVLRGEELVARTLRIKWWARCHVAGIRKDLPTEFKQVLLTLPLLQKG